MLTKPIWVTAPVKEPATGAKLNAMVNYSQTIGGIPYADTAPNDGDVMAFDEATETFKPVGTSVISGEAVVEDLEIDDASEVTIDHSGDGVFASREYPVITAPVGVRVTVLAVGSNGDSTNGSQFVLLVENIAHATNLGYGGVAPDVLLEWTRKGSLA